MALRYVVTGGRPLSGTVRPAGNKNAALPILAASLLAESPVDLGNIPRIRDVEMMLALLQHLGATAEWTGPNSLRVDPRGATAQPLDPDLCARIRASILLAAPLLARFGQVVLPPPGGDVIGRRRVDTHFLALEALGATVMVGDRYEIEARKLTGADIFLDEPSVTGTENALMAAGAVNAEGAAVLRKALEEMDGVFAVFLPAEDRLSAEEQALFDARQAARVRRDFAGADAARHELESLGVVLEDTPKGTRWRRKR